MHPDFKELLSAFNEGRVKYLVVGGYAVSIHAEPRVTKDLDILVAADAENSEAVFAALAKFGAPVEGLSPKDFMDLDNFFRMGTPPVMVDIMPRISGVEFEEAWQRRVNVPIDDNLTASFISRQDLLTAKMAAGRAQDIADVDALLQSARHRDGERPSPPTESSKAFEGIRQAQARGVEEWLKLRKQQLRGDRTPTLQEMQAKARDDWKKYREQENEKFRDPHEHNKQKDPTLDSERDAGKGIEDDDAG